MTCRRRMGFDVTLRVLIPVEHLDKRHPENVIVIGSSHIERQSPN
jgi:hypothetical protein